ncbi:hypothetical protein PISMIDRAFT_671726 [Pisolithus microcarpus 441]|uniref:DUF726-domain-containing protein n=1 Tax=Pisolithus microcarpus 441 TaxID=765257 RepID=A0A0D0ACG4_9AGAM|nr:hypothetical protein BKA83DRAFT_671726 [Pisolithus microcarpus]KIK29783.1 hypothetical protein PISMIDRAFT_671726 [Pisolithus microcarpus 441]
MSTSARIHSSQVHNWFDGDEDDEGWQDMPVVKEDDPACALDEEDQKKYHYVQPEKKNATGTTGNAIGNLIDFDDTGIEWRSKAEQNENEYTRLRVEEEDDADEVNLRTRYLFDEDKAMTPLSQMQTTKNMLTEAQRIAYVGLCALTAKEMVKQLKRSNRKELKPAAQNMELWMMKILGRLYYHMELETAEQKMIDSLDMHGVQASDLVPSLMTTHTVANPEYDPAEAKRQADGQQLKQDDSGDTSQLIECSKSSQMAQSPTPTKSTFQTTSRVLEGTSVASAALPGVTTSLSAVDKDVTLDIRWTVLCDLFLILIADSVYDARSRVLLENVALKLGLGWIDVAKFECRVTEALEIQEGVEKTENQEIIDDTSKALRKRRYMMVGLATLGGGLVIGLSAGLLAPVIGAGLGAAFTTIGISGTTGFLAGAGGAAVITTGGVLTGSGIAARGMARRTRQVKTFEVLPLHNNKRVSCILTVPGFMNGKLDDVRLPFSVLDPIAGDVFSVLWEPEMIMETGSAIKILTTEILTQIGQTVLQHTVMTALMGALQWPIMLTKLGYLIDNPWSNALDRAKSAGGVLAQLLIQRHLGVRPITLIGFSLGARVIFYALLELAKSKAFGIVQDVFLLGGTLTASQSAWYEVRSVVSGRFVNAYARNDWVLNYLFRATSAGLSSVAGLRPVEDVPGVENVDVTDKISGHMSYRTFMPLILDQLGFPVSADYFDEPVEPEFKEERVVIRDEELDSQKKGWFSRKKKQAPAKSSRVSRPPFTSAAGPRTKSSLSKPSEDELPPRTDVTDSPAYQPATDATATAPDRESIDSTPEIPSHAGFDLGAIRRAIGESQHHPEELHIPQPGPSKVQAKFTPLAVRWPAISAPHSPLPLPEDLTLARDSSVSNRSQSVLGSLDTRFASTLSLRDGSAGDDDKAGVLENDNDDDDVARSTSTSNPPRGSPGISYSAAEEESIWPSNGPVANSTGITTLAFENPFGTSTDVLSRGASSTGQSGTHGIRDPSASLSFGSLDGRITLHGGVEQDPWNTPETNKSLSYFSNPWST